VDSAQLLPFVPRETTPWLDLGTGAGFPGVVIAALRPDTTVVMVESRAKRIDWLAHLIAELDLPQARVIGSRLEVVETFPAGAISARAYAPLDRLLKTAHHLADENTVWLLPKGRNGEKELAIARQQWQAVFHVEQSLTDADSAIIIAGDVSPRMTPKRSGKPMNPRKNRRAT
jgi:16S rRNA (guanine527-N7)-methyltransferase